MSVLFMCASSFKNEFVYLLNYFLIDIFKRVRILYLILFMYASMNVIIYYISNSFRTIIIKLN